MLDLYLKIILYHVLNVVKIFELLPKVKKIYKILRSLNPHFAGGGSVEIFTGDDILFDFFTLTNANATKSVLEYFKVPV